MRASLKAIFASVLEDFGRPVKLCAMLKEHPGFSASLAEPEPDIALASVVRWHEWGEKSAYDYANNNRGEVMGWKSAGGSYSGFSVKRDEFLNFGSCTSLDQWECDIRDVTGLSSSKSTLEDFVSLDEMVETNSREMIEPITQRKLHENLAWKEIGILNRENSSDFFAQHLWDGRVFLANDGGSHHFAAARYLAHRLDAHVPLHGRLRMYEINARAVESLRRDFEMFVVSSEPNALSGFHDAMQGVRAPYFWQHLPRPIEDKRAILLPRSDARAMRVAAVLHEAGFFDLGVHLRALLAHQEQVRDRYALSCRSPGLSARKAANRPG